LNTIASPSSTGSVPAGMPFKLFADGALMKQGVIDSSGQLPIDHQVTTQQYKLELANGVTHEIPVPAQYRGDASNGALANLGFQYHEGLPADAAAVVDRAAHRQGYSDLLNPSSEA
jgi:type VI secretion system secreted protein VgrG